MILVVVVVVVLVEVAVQVAVAVVDLGFMMLLTSQVIKVAFYSEHEVWQILLRGTNFGLRFFYVP